MILFVTDAPEKHGEMIRALSQRFVFTAVLPFSQASQYCVEQSTGGTILDCTTRPSRAERFYKRLVGCYPQMPILALIDEATDPTPYTDCLICRIREDDPVRAATDFCIGTCGFDTEPLSTHCLFVSDNPKETVYMGYPFPLSPREHRLLRCLLYLAPATVSNDLLTRLCYPLSPPRTTTIANTVAKINRAASRQHPAPLIVNEYNKGYRLQPGVLCPAVEKPLFP